VIPEHGRPRLHCSVTEHGPAGYTESAPTLQTQRVLRSELCQLWSSPSPPAAVGSPHVTPKVCNPQI